MSDRETLKLVYEQTCQSYHAVADFRGKLLALLPLASGTGIFLLLRDGGPQDDVSKSLLGPIGVFGLVVTVGLFVYELRGIQRCHRLEKQAEALEEALNLTQDQGGVLHQPPRSLGDMFGPPAASLIVYLAVIFAWIYLAGVGQEWWGPGNSHSSRGTLGLGVGYTIALTVTWPLVRWWLKRTASLEASIQSDDAVERA